MGVRKSNTLLKATTAIALMSGALGSNNYEMKQQNNKLNTRRAHNKNNSSPHHHHNGMAGFVADNSNNKKNRRDLTEDIDFFTRMTQATGSIPMPRPTPFPVAASVPPAPIPTNPPQVISTPNPTDPPVPVPVSTPNPTDPPVPQPTDPPVTDAPTVPLVCGITEEERATQMRELALTITDEATLNDQASPQAKALNWLLTEDTLDPPVCPDDGPCGARQRYIMASFYYASGGGTWDQCNAPQRNTAGAIALANANCDRVVTPFPVNNPRIGDKSTDAWLTGVDECLWGGLACWGTDDDRNGCLDQIDFENDGLSGNLIPEVTNLDELRFFILEQGEIGGTIPSQFGEFDRLLIFDLDFNELSGNIPDELFDMNVLQQLDLNDNNLEGTLSTNIGSMTTLTFLQLDHNNLEGNIPSEVGLLNSLREYNLVFVFCCLILIGTNI